jgi:hypothetical protein
LPQDFCCQVVRETRSNAYAFQGFTTPHGGKKTRQDFKLFIDRPLVKSASDNLFQRFGGLRCSFIYKLFVCRIWL